MDTVRNNFYTGPSSLTFFRDSKAFKAFQLCKVGQFFIWEEWKRTLLSHPWEKLMLLPWAKASVVFLWITKGSQRILSQLKPLPGPGAADLHKFPDPGATSDSGVSRWSQRLSLAWLSVQALQRFLHWPLLCDKLLCCHSRPLLTQHCP